MYMGTILSFVSQSAAKSRASAPFLHYIKLGRVSGLLSIRGERYYGVRSHVAREPNAFRRLLPEYLDYRDRRLLRRGKHGNALVR